MTEQRIYIAVSVKRAAIGDKTLTVRMGSRGTAADEVFVLSLPAATALQRALADQLRRVGVKTRRPKNQTEAAADIAAALEPEHCL